MTVRVNYTLDTGNKGSKRLDLQSQVLQQRTLQHLIASGVSQGQVVYDIGCGHGAATEILASSVGPQGRVIAIDFSTEQLKLAKQRTDQAGLTNIVYKKLDIETDSFSNLEPGQLVFSRLFLMHLKNPIGALEKMKNILDSNGTIVLEETIFSTAKFTETPTRLESLFQEMLKAGKELGLDYDIGLCLRTLVEQVSLDIKNEEIYQEEIPCELARTFMGLLHEEWVQKNFENGKVTKQQYDQWLHEIHEINSPFLFSKIIYLTAQAS